MTTTKTTREDQVDPAAGTLGGLLYADNRKARIPEADWVRLVQAVARRDEGALRALYQRTHRPVFTLIVRITGNPEIAEELTLDVFQDVLRGAPDYDPGDGSVLGWIMNQARSRTIDRLPVEQASGLAEQRRVLGNALSRLTPDERQAIEIAFFSEFTHMQVAARLNESLGTVKTRIRSGLSELRQALAGNTLMESSEAGCRRAEQLFAFALQAVPPHEAVALEAHVAKCADCRKELDSLRSVVETFVAWPTDVLRPSRALWSRLAERIAAETGESPDVPVRSSWLEPEWEEVAPGITCKLLATSTEPARVSMLVRLAPGGAYPPHRHAGTEELHLLDGELFIEDRKLLPGDYNRGEAGASDQFVWSGTGCTCVLITSTRDVLQ